ncbi:MAG: proteasome-activating nucleotidase [Euryarchaeota archaeon]|nr:proteasome-activating nucleotidase [Euryarchaeota archaeon]|tara:strand:- start:65 stop:1294 length:1230 start_codon:yes stop_codon:yes gene_type:complete
MSSDAGTRKPHSGTDENRSEEDLRQLEDDYRQLHDQAQKLITERVALESDINKLKKRTARLDEEIRLLKSPPLIVGHIQDVIDEEYAIVRSSNGTVFQVAVNKRLQTSELKPGTRVALNQDTLAVTSLLHDAWDPLVSGAEMIERPETAYDEIGGLDEEILKLREAIELPLEKPEVFQKVGIEPPKGVLLVGPPGCGKTMIAKAVASQTKATFIRMVGSELAQKYIGEGGRMVRELFSLARDKSPAIIFLDEIDAIGAKRLDAATSGDREVQRTLMQLLAELDGFDALESVKIIAATNRPDILDDALLRPGRFDRIVEIPLPEDAARKSILSIHVSKMSTSRISMPRLVELTKGFSGADLKATCVEAGMVAIRDGRSKVLQNDFQTAVQTVIKKRDKNASLASASDLYV